MSTKKNMETGVAKPLDFSSVTQENIPEMLLQVNKRIAAIQGEMPEQKKTTGSLAGFGKIAEIKDMGTLIKAYSVLLAKKKAYTEAAKALGVEPKKTPKFMLDGSSFTDWENDIKLRAVQVKYDTDLKKLTAVKKKLEENLSEKDKLQKDLADVMRLISDDE